MFIYYAVSYKRLEHLEILCLHRVVEHVSYGYIWATMFDIIQFFK